MPVRQRPEAGDRFRRDPARALDLRHGPFPRLRALRPTGGRPSDGPSPRLLRGAGADRAERRLALRDYGGGGGLSTVLGGRPPSGTYVSVMKGGPGVFSETG